MNDAPIGLIDSGSGGLSIWKEISSLLPHESTVYIGDHGHMPYSNKTTAYIRDRICRVIQFLSDKKAKFIVVACNTATVAGIDWYREKFPRIPIVGVVPVIKTAAQITKTRRIAVLSTVFTAHSVYQRRLIRQFAKGCKVTVIGSTQLVSLIEQGNPSGDAMSQELGRILSPITKEAIDVLVLGCTHYPFVRDQIRAIVGDSVAVLDSGEAVARQVKRILDHDNTAAGEVRGMHTFFTTGEPNHVGQTASLLLRREISIDYAAI